MLSFSIVSFTLFDSIQIRVVGENPNLNSRSSKAVTKDPFASIQWGNFFGLDMDYTIVQIFPRKKRGEKKEEKETFWSWLAFFLFFAHLASYCKKRLNLVVVQQ